MRLTILHTSDLHANLHPWNYFTGAPAEHGLAKLATLIKRTRASTQDPVLLIDSGDTIQGSPLGTYYAQVERVSPHPMACAFNALAYDAFTPGNHDFNFGPQVLQDFVTDLNCPVICANILRQNGDPLFQPYRIQTVQGIRVGLLGLTTPRIDTWERPDHIVGLRFAPILETAHHYLPLLRPQVDVLVVILHSGPNRLPPQRSPEHWRTPDRSDWRSNKSLNGENELLSLAQLEDIDVILSGHTHQTIAGLEQAKPLVVQPGFWGSHLSRVSLELEEQGQGWRVHGGQVDILSAEGIPPDPELLALTDPYHQATLHYVHQPVGHARAPYPGGLAARLGANPLAELLHQAQLQAVREAGFPAELSLVNICSSAGLAAGPIRLQDAYGITVYDNTLCVLEVSGEILRRALEQTAGYFRQLDPDHLPAEPTAVVAPDARGYTFDLYHGIDYCFDLTRPVGKRLVNLQFRGQPVEPTQTFRLAINHYRAGGGGGYVMFQEAETLWISADSIRDFLVYYINTHSPIQPLYSHNWSLIPDLAEIYFPNYFSRPQESLLVG
ncbi:bifunctional metallophosphatase/5'-nucleotidase [Thermostichus vulcanus]|uniref:5'-nucleotidase C-terminal domain-containing protein n=1 Tax=Thermostichus vulcanus str. 'Rupite' TaxID=2813851 RepID=A0ABT0CAD8_THEVL|nr:5'-nucleotidase C-terminal domain-containing protein [Thermostichus vulcanus]MCJ2542752.1 5'-nucleotidase C-terminal domain-containing protein [Thermostichus vulcanus str. 'Rupite']